MSADSTASTSLLPAVLLDAAAATRGDSPVAAAIPLDGGGLPMAVIEVRRTDKVSWFAKSRLDDVGRVAIRAGAETLQWSLPTHVTITAHPESHMIVIRRGGEYAVSKRGHLHLPVSVRRACRLQTADHLLLLARVGHRDLYVYTAAALEAIFTGHETARSGNSS